MENAPLAFQIKRARRKTLAIHVLADLRVEVRAPWHVSDREVFQFVQAKQDWIIKAQQRLRQREVRVEPCYAFGTRHYFLGQPHLLVAASQAATQGDLQRADSPQTDQIVLVISADSSAQSIEAALLAWYRERALEYFAARMTYWHTQVPHCPPVRLKLRRMRRRWGSCRSDGQITLNTDLIRYPHACIDAVIVHELCHLKVMNHSPQFYAWMSHVMPEWRAADQTLKAAARCY